MDQSALRSVAPYLIGGILLFAVGAWVAQGRLPAWSLQSLDDRASFEDRYRALAQAAGFILVPDDPSLSLVSREVVQDTRATEPVYEPGRPDVPVLVRVAHGASHRDMGDAELVVGLSPDGQAQTVSWMPRSLAGMMRQSRLSLARRTTRSDENGGEPEADGQSARPVAASAATAQGDPGEESAEGGGREEEGQDEEGREEDGGEASEREPARPEPEEPEPEAPEPEEPEDILASLLAPPDRELRTDQSTSRLSLGLETVLYPLDGSPPAHVEIVDPPVGALQGFLRRGDANPSQESYELFQKLLSLVVWVLIFLTVIGLFFAFLGRRRIDLINGTFLATTTFVLLFPAILFQHKGLLWGIEGFLAALGPSLWVLMLWSTGESWLRALQSEFSSSLDALRVGRLGPRGGRALLGGLGVGAGLAGLRLLLLAGTETTELVGRTGLSVPLPIFQVGRNPWSEAILMAAAVLMVAVICLRCLPRRWAMLVAAPIVALALRPVPLAPTLAAVVAGALVVGGLLFAFQRFELTGLLTACLGLYTLPAVGVSVQLLDWMPGSFALTTGLLLTVASVGLMGLGREEEQEARGMGAPAFVRRLEDEKRLHHEMGLLARMQLGLLPADLPRLDGWEISARSVLATEVGGDLYDFLWDDEGRLWVAAGDVSGHGYSCAIVHAMTKAALASLVGPDRTPGRVLEQVDRVLRGVRYRRAFTSLALLQLDPKTGQGLLANAGHPYPLLFSDGQVRDLEIPGLPLGQGPTRTYDDTEVHLEVGAVLVLCSDGLFEATDREVRAYGFDRPRQLLVKAARWPSNEVLEMLLADWRRHRGSVAAADDTTVLVIKRLSAEETRAGARRTAQRASGGVGT